MEHWNVLDTLAVASFVYFLAVAIGIYLDEEIGDEWKREAIFWLVVSGVFAIAVCLIGSQSISQIDQDYANKLAEYEKMLKK